MRSSSILDEANQVRDSDFVGFDFAGDELNYGPAAIKPLIEQVKSYNRPMTFHAGECGCPAFLAESIAMGIKRNGHATILAQEPELLDEFVKNGVTGELCLTSNLQTKAAVTVNDFPYLKMKAAGANITINTDNRTVSDTNLTKEYELYHKYFDSTVQDFYAHNKTAIEASFASDEEKEELLARLAKAIEILKVAYNYEEQGKPVVLLTSRLDDRDEVGYISSRIGMRRKAYPIGNDTDIFDYIDDISPRPYCVLIDEAQFLTRANVYDLARIVDELDIPVMAFGLKNDFQNNLFEGSKYLLLLSDKIEEIKTICHYCSRKATMVLRMEDGEPVYEGVQVQIGGHESYISVCRKHWFNPPRERIVPLK